MSFSAYSRNVGFLDLSHKSNLAAHQNNFTKHNGTDLDPSHADDVISSFKEINNGVNPIYCSGYETSTKSPNSPLFACLKWFSQYDLDGLVIAFEASGIQKHSFDELSLIASKIPVVISAGNDPKVFNNAFCKIKNVYCVGALDSTGKIASYSARGELVKYWEDGTHKDSQGTSFAAPKFLARLLKK